MKNINHENIWKFKQITGIVLVRGYQTTIHIVSALEPLVTVSEPLYFLIALKLPL